MSMTKKEADTAIGELLEKIEEVVKMSKREIIESFEAQGSLAVSISVTMRGSSDVVDGNVGISFTVDKYKLNKPLHIEIRQKPLEFNDGAPKNETPEQEKERLKKEEKEKRLKDERDKTKALVEERKQKPGESDSAHEKRMKAIDARLEKEKEEADKSKTKTKKVKAKKATSKKAAA